jgi:DNA-binding transcriptional ArsR family regulator
MSTQRRQKKLTRISAIKALEKVLMYEQKTVEERGWRDETSAILQGLLLNVRRREIYQYLCTYPCVTLNKICEKLGSSPALILHHLKKLTEAKFVSTAKVSKRQVYYPTQLIREDLIEVFTALSEPEKHVVFKCILNKPLQTQQELAYATEIKYQRITKHLHELERVGLLISIKDGKFKRFKATELYTKVLRTCMRRADGFKRYVLKKLVIDGLSPTLIRATDEELQVEIDTPTRRDVFTLPTLPYTGIHFKVVPELSEE